MSSLASVKSSSTGSKCSLNIPVIEHESICEIERQYQLLEAFITHKYFLSADIIKKVMERNSGVVRIKEKTNNIWLDAGDDNFFNSVDSCKSENSETLLFCESSTTHANEGGSDEKIFIDYECKDVKIELKSLPTSICKSEFQEFQSTVKVENENLTNDVMNENAFAYLQTSKKHVNAVQDRRKPSECEINHKSFGEQTKLKSHMLTVIHDRSKYLDCDVCRRSFSNNGGLSQHMNKKHDRKKFIKCDKCHESFRYQKTLKIHTRIKHVLSKSFKCEICHKSFSKIALFNSHAKSVHDFRKSFECKICHQSYVRKKTLRLHINSVHDRSKPFECEICHKSFGYQNILQMHINVVHRRGNSSNATKVT